MIRVIERRNIYLGLGATLILVSIICVLMFGLRLGIDLTGGSLLEIAVTGEGGAPVSEIQMREVLGTEAHIRKSPGNTLSIRMPSLSEEEHQALLKKIGAVYSVFEELSFSSIGPLIGAELRTQAYYAVVLVLLGISLYVAYAFRRASVRIRSWKYGIVTLLTLVHDVVIPTGLLAVLGKLSNVEIDTNFIVALLVVMGFSVHDTIVVFDRIRENIVTAKLKNAELDHVVNASVNETMARSLNTSLTLVLVLIALLLFGPQSLFYFILTILVGTIVGTYSSIFIASPLIYLWGRKQG